MYRKRIKNGIESWEHRNTTICDCCGKEKLVTFMDCDKYFHYNIFYNETICLDCKKNHPKYCPSCECIQINDGECCLNCKKPIMVLHTEHIRNPIYCGYILKKGNISVLEHVYFEKLITVICPECTSKRRILLGPGITRTKCTCGEETFYTKNGTPITIFEDKLCLIE